ncbi:MAG: sulfotransferase [Proteobacteria bacterium]|nr:sulfotransferase [Pseudomonadota bacterium]
MLTDPAAAHHEVLALIARADLPSALRACEQLLAAHPHYARGWTTASALALRLGHATEALRRAERAAALDAHEVQALILQARCLQALQRGAEALAVAARARAAADGEPLALDAVGTCFSALGDQFGALSAFDAAVALAPREPRLRYNRATIRRYVGDLDGAESDLEVVIDLDPRDHEAYGLLADLRPQTPARNHVAALERRLADPPGAWQAEVTLRYALAKEYEDLGRHAESFAQLQRGARLRRSHLQYDVAMDVDTAGWIRDAFPDAGPVTDGADARSPIFVVGLPRSGTTLVERILGCHTGVHAAGELPHFAQALVEAVGRLAGGAALARRERVARSREIDFAALGRDYLRRSGGDALGALRLTDKMPLNYLYCGLIHRALPAARIVHVVRHPMAVCYAMYKTLFRDGYPFSYDLDEIARYYVAYRGLMQHWSRILPGVLHEVRYEALVADPPGESRRLLAGCGLDWQDACGAPHRHPAASTTQSAAQVRRPIYDSAVALWRCHEAALAPLRRRLAELGVPAAELDA